MRVAHRTNDPLMFDHALDRTRQAGRMVRLLGHLADRVEDDGLLVRDSDEVRLLPRGRLLILNICIVFDHYLPPIEQQKGFSRVI